MSNCEICGQPLVNIGGWRSSPILLVGEFPGWEELKYLVPWIGNAGKVLANELGRAGVQFERCKTTNLWRHAVPEDKPTKEREFDYHYKLLIEELKKAKAVFLMGSDLAELFFKKKVTYINGCVMHSERLPSNIEVAIVSLNPAVCLQRDSVAGDFRYACQRFAQATKGIR